MLPVIIPGCIASAWIDDGKAKISRRFCAGVVARHESRYNGSSASMPDLNSLIHIHDTVIIISYDTPINLHRIPFDFGFFFHFFSSGKYCGCIWFFRFFDVNNSHARFFNDVRRKSLWNHQIFLYSRWWSALIKVGHMFCFVACWCSYTTLLDRWRSRNRAGISVRPLQAVESL